MRRDKIHNTAVIKLNLQLPVSPTNRDESAKAELELRKRQAKAVDLLKSTCRVARGPHRQNQSLLQHPQGRLITCDYDITMDDILKARHFDDDVFVYGFMTRARGYKLAAAEPTASPTVRCVPRASRTCWWRA